MRPLILALAAALATTAAAPAVAQGWAPQHRSYGWDTRSQYDRPGDYRCDAYWDANRSDCDARWRDQRRYSSHGRYDGWSEGRGYRDHRRWSSYPRSQADAWRGAYGRPDLVYPGGGHHQGGWSDGARDPRRIDWCRASYRSYDPASGYYRAYDGRVIFCG